MNQLSFPTTSESKLLRKLVTQRLEYIKNQLELFNTKYPRSSGSDLIINAYQKEQQELLVIKMKLSGGNQNENQS